MAFLTNSMPLLAGIQNAFQRCVKGLSLEALRESEQLERTVESHFQKLEQILSKRSELRTIITHDKKLYSAILIELFKAIDKAICTYLTIKPDPSDHLSDHYTTVLKALFQETTEAWEEAARRVKLIQRCLPTNELREIYKSYDQLAEVFEAAAKNWQQNRIINYKIFSQTVDDLKAAQ